MEIFRPGCSAREKITRCLTGLSVIILPLLLEKPFFLQRNCTRVSTPD